MDNATQSSGLSPLPSSQYSIDHYNLNDMINMTCLMGPSKPAASLRWFINDLSVEPDSQWLTLRHYNEAGQQISDSVVNTKATSGPVETQLTIAFQLQASHLFMQQRHPKAFNPHRNANGGGGGHWLVQLRCTAYLGVEFASETSLKLADGKTVVKNRRQDSGDSSPSSILPQPSSQGRRSGSGESPSLEHSSRAGSGKYRARSSVSPTRAAQMSAYSPVDFAYKWPPVRLPQVTASDWRDGAGSNERQSPVVLLGPTPSNQRTSANQLLVVVWTNRQIKAQSEHIEQLLQRTKPNQLEPPIIEASIKAPTSKSSANYGDEGEGDSTGIELQPGDNETAYARNWRHSPSNSSVPDEESDTGAPDQEPERDLFEFTCTSRLNSPERDLLGDVRLVWSLNNKQVRGDRVNAFDGSIFYYSGDPKGKQTKPNDTIVNGSSGRSRIPDQRYPVVVRRRNWQQQQSLVADQKQSDQKKSTLLIDMTPDLMQLKELDLKCRTVVVQPLIEFETIGQSVVAMTAATTSALPNSPSSPFIHATVDRDTSSPGGSLLFSDNNQQDQSMPTGGGRGRVTNVRTPNGYYQRRNPLLANKNNNSDSNNTNNHRPAKHWTSVIRLRQQPSASSSSTSGIDPQRLYHFCVGQLIFNFIAIAALFIYRDYSIRVP